MPREGFVSSTDISPQTIAVISEERLETLRTTSQPNNVLIALNYSGWEQGQLERELLENS